MPRRKRPSYGHKRKYQQKRHVKNPEIVTLEENTETTIPVEDTQSDSNSFIETQALENLGAVTDDLSDLANRQSCSIECSNDRHTKQAAPEMVKEEPTSAVPNSMLFDSAWPQSSTMETHSSKEGSRLTCESQVNLEPTFGDHLGPQSDITATWTQYEPSDETVHAVEKDVDHMYARNCSEKTDTEDRAADEYIGYNIVKVERCSPSDSFGDVQVYSGQQDSRSHDYEWENYSPLDSSVAKQSFLPPDSTGEEWLGAIDVDFEEVEVESASFQSLLRSVETRGFLLMQTEREIQFVQLYKTPTPSVKLSVCVDEYFSCNVSVHRQPVDRSHSIWRGLPDKFDDASSLIELLDRINKLTVCCGNTDDAYHELIGFGETLTTNSDIDVETTVAYREGDFGALMSDGEPYSTTVRSTQCSLLTDKPLKCAKCIKLNSSLKERLKKVQERKTKNKGFLHTSFKHKDMTRDELYKKLGEQRAEITSLQNQVAKLERKLRKEDRQRQQQDEPYFAGLACSGIDDSMSIPDSSQGTPLSKLAPSLEKPGMIAGKTKLNRHLTTNKNLYICEKCGRPFKHRHSLVTHTQIVHNGEKPEIKCQVCDKMFYRSCAMKVHMRVHTGEKTRMCDICGKTFNKNENLILHKRTHTGEKPYICRLCGLSFVASSNLKRHTRVVHIGEKKYLCNACGKRFGSKVNLQEHTRVHTGEKPYKCTECDKKFRVKTDCTYHMRIHHEGRNELCGDGSRIKSSSWRPSQKQCTVCDKVVTNLKAHMYTHTGEKPYQCQTCDKRFTSKFGMISHSKIHTGEKPYKCEVCEQAFRDLCNMKRHMNVVHMGIKKHMCNLCGEQFGKKESLQLHSRKVHAGE